MRFDGPAGPNTVEVVHDNGQVTLSSPTTTSATVNTNELGSSVPTNITEISASGTNLTIDTPQTRPVTVGGAITQTAVNTSITQADGVADFQYTATGDATIQVGGLDPNLIYVLRDVDDGEVVALAQADSGGTVTWNNPTTGTHNVEIGDYALEVRDVKTGALIDDATIEFRFFEEGTDRVFTESTSNGIVSIGQLPGDSAFSVTANATGKVTRTSFFEDPRQQQTIFLLDESQTTKLVRFNVEDRTGDFSDDVRIQIERSINTSDSPAGEERYRIVAGDIVDSQLEFDTTLERDVRYRISISDGEGNERQLGNFLIKTDQVIDLVVSGIDVGFTRPDGQTQLNATQTVDENTGDKTVTLTVQDPSQETTDITVDVVPYDNPDQVIDSGSTQGPVGEFTFTSTVTGADAEKRLLAKVTYAYEGDEISTTIPFGAERFNLLPGLDPDWRAIFGVGFLLVLGGVFSVANARIGALIIPGAALALNLTGILTTVVTATSVGLAFAVAVGINIIEGSGDTLR
jgi:plastocyanin